MVSSVACDAWEKVKICYKKMCRAYLNKKMRLWQNCFLIWSDKIAKSEFGSEVYGVARLRIKSLFVIEIQRAEQMFALQWAFFQLMAFGCLQTLVVSSYSKFVSSRWKFGSRKASFWTLQETPSLFIKHQTKTKNRSWRWNKQQIFSTEILCPWGQT